MVGRFIRVVGLVLSALALSLWTPFGEVFGDSSVGASAAAQVDEVSPEDRVSPADLPALDEGGSRQALPPDPRLSESKVSDPPERAEPAKLDPKRPPVADLEKVD